MEECAICYEKKELFTTECRHNFCINCMSKLHNCAICRATLNRPKLCSEIKLVNFKTQMYNSNETLIEGPYLSTLLPIIDIMHENGDDDFQLPLRMDMSIHEDVLNERVNNLSPNIREEIIRLITLYQLTNDILPCDEEINPVTGCCFRWLMWLHSWIACC